MDLRSHVRGGGAEIPRDPPQFNRTIIYLSLSLYLLSFVFTVILVNGHCCLN